VPTAGLAPAGEGDLGDVGVLDEPLPADRPRAGDDVEDPLGDAGREGDALELDRRQRRQLGGLEDHRAAGGWWQFPVGGGIVAQSNPRQEYEETWQKATGMLRALT